MIKTALKRAAVSFAILVGIGEGIAAAADECPKPSEILYGGAGKLTSDSSYAGQLYWLPSGTASFDLHRIDGCVSIPVGGRSKLYFAIGDALTQITPEENFAFVAVQVLRVQRTERPVQVRISRFGNWQREDTKAVGPLIDDQPIQDVTLQEFFEIHKKMTVSHRSGMTKSNMMAFCGMVDQWVAFIHQWEREVSSLRQT